MSGYETDLVAAAENVLKRSPSGSDALVQLEWAPQPSSHDPTWFEAMLSLFRAQGRVLAATPALGLLTAHALVATLASDDYTTCAAVSSRRVGGRIELLCPAGSLDNGQIVADVPGEPLAAVAVSDLSPTGPAPAAFDPDCAVRTSCAGSDLRPIQGIQTGGPSSALWLARVAIASEILGASERLLESAVQYAKDREQFGQSIGSFQAVQHRLAEARIRLTSLVDAVGHAETVCGKFEAAESDHFAAILKALAGRVGEEVIQASFQIFGGIGFTWEHHLHLYQRRILTLDALYGSADELVVELGAGAVGRRVMRTPVL